MMIAVSAQMESKEAAQSLYDHVKVSVSPERLSIVDGARVVAEDRPEAAGMIAEEFAKFLIGR